MNNLQQNREVSDVVEAFINYMKNYCQLERNIYRIEDISNMDSLIPIKKYLTDNGVEKIFDLEEKEIRLVKYVFLLVGRAHS